MNNKMSGSIYRITDNNSGKFVPLVDGDHSYTHQEFETLQKLQLYKSKKLYNKEKLVTKENDEWKYYMVEDGTIFKMNDDYFFYRLNINTFQWIRDQRLVSLYNDCFLRFKELPGFEDYYEVLDTEEKYKSLDVDLNEGRHL